jgi:flavodoxin
MSAILTVYYSYTGQTRDLAEIIALLTNSDIVELRPRKEYSFAHNTASKEIRSEIERGFCPALEPVNAEIAKYDTFFIGTPNWFKSIAPPLLTFLKQHDFTGKVVIPFCTHGGGGFGDIESIVARECSNATILSGIAVNGAYSEKQVADWLISIGVV